VINVPMVCDHLLDDRWTNNRFWLWWRRRWRRRGWRTLLHASDNDFVLDLLPRRR